MHKTLVGAACLSLQPLVLNVLSVPMMAYIINRMGPERYAQWMAAVALLTLFAVLTNLGLRGAFVRSIAGDPGSAATALAEQLGLRLLLAMMAGALVVLICLLLGYPFVVVLSAMVGAAGLALTTVATTLADLLQAVQRIKTLAAVSLAAGLTLIAVSAMAAWQGAGPVEMAAAYVTGPALSAALLFAIVRARVCPVRLRWDVSRFRRLLVGSRFFAAQQLLFGGSAQAEMLLLPRLIGMNQFGFFTAGTMLANRLIVLPDALCTAAYPAMVKACEHGAPRGAGLVLKYLGLAALAGFVIAMAGTFFADAIGRLILPGQSALFAFVVRVTIWSLPLIGVELVMGYALNAAGRDAVQARLAVPAAAVSLLGSVALISALGLTGACWSMLFRPAVRAAFLAPVALRTFRPAKASRRDGGNIVLAQSEIVLRKAG